MTAFTLPIDRRALLGGGVALGATSLLSGTALAQGPPYRFGLALPLRGPQALYGSDLIQAAELAVAEINKAGGINGKKLEMVVLDTQADPQVGINAVNRLVRVENVPVFVTGFSGVVKDVAPIANDNKVVELSVGANSPSVAQLGKKRAAVLYIDETGPVAAEVYRKTFTPAGGQIVAFEALIPRRPPSPVKSSRRARPISRSSIITGWSRTRRSSSPR